MKKPSTPISLLLCLLLTALLHAKDFWEKKDYKDWSERECRKLLQDSPWTQTYAIGDTVIELFETQRTDRAREANPRIMYNVQFRSALPIRQAQIRMAQIQMKYDQLPPEQQSSFDQQAEQYLELSFADNVAVHVSFASNVPIYDRELLQYWQNMTLEQVRNTTYLIGAKGTRVQPTEFQRYEAGRQEFALIFPRQHDGKLLAGPKDKRISLEFEHPAVGELGARRVFVQFPVKKMVIDGIVVY